MSELLVLCISGGPSAIGLLLLYARSVGAVRVYGCNEEPGEYVTNKIGPKDNSEPSMQWK